MLRFLLPLLAPGEKIPPGSNQLSIGWEGLSWGWAFFAFVVLVAATIWNYARFAPGLPIVPRILLVTLRSFFFALILLLLVHPVLLATIEETVRRPLIVMLDTTASMTLQDRRSAPEDLVRAGIATGALDPAGGLKQTPPSDDKLKALSRHDLLEALAANSRLNFWPRLQARSSLQFYGFGRKLGPLGELVPGDKTSLSAQDAAGYFHDLHDGENLTAIGDSMRQLLDAQRGQPVAGVLLITDGANNSGSSPIEAASIAREDGVPLFIYAVGVTSPKDVMVAELSGPQVSNVKEKLTVTARVRGQSMQGKKVVVQLKANGKVVDEEPLEFRSDEEQEINLSYTPDQVGMVELEAVVPPLPEEAMKDNNSASTRVRITDDKLKVLYVEQAPTWDFRFLLDMLQRDRRLKVKCVVIQGDKGLENKPDSPFLDTLPEDRETLFANDLIILGDVDPAALGDARMKLFSEWVNKMGGGLVFRAGRNFDPASYKGTPLEPMLPVEIGGKKAENYPTPVQLKLTPQGEASPFLQAVQNPEGNLSIWRGFPGVIWTAWVGRARPGAQVLLTDPNPERSNQEGPLPVLALQSYGLGQTLYVGFEESYRWRAKAGEKYYTRIWGQMIQAVTAQRMAGASALTQLRTNRPTYLTGDTVKVSGRIFQSGFTPLTDPEVPGTVTFTPEPKPGQPGTVPVTREMRLRSISDRPGEYRSEMLMTAAGSYSFATARDPKAEVKWQVMEPKVELSDVAMNEKLLRAMASASGGHFFREEDLNGLPDLLASQSSNSVSFKKIPLTFTPFLLGLMIVVACLEWWWRRTRELK